MSNRIYKNEAAITLKQPIEEKMDIETIKKLLEQEGLEFKYYHKGWVLCDDQKFERSSSDWNDKCAPEFEKKWRDKLLHISDQLHFIYTIYHHYEGETSYVGISLFLGEIEYDLFADDNPDDFENLQEYMEYKDFWGKSLEIASDARINRVNPIIIEITEEYSAKYCEPDW